MSVINGEPDKFKAVGNEVLRLENVTREFRKGAETVHALRGISLSVRTGELVAVMGPSGSGKSTFMMLAGGLDQPTHGTVIVEGAKLSDLNAKELAVLRSQVSAGAAAIVVTHDPVVAASADRVIRLRDGLIEKESMAFA